jgi:hypothetical protein
MRVLLATALLLSVVAGCSYPHVQYEIGSKAVYYSEESVRRTEPRIDIQPETPPLRPMTAVFLPFKVRQAMDNAAFVGQETGRIFWQNWVRQGVFPVIEYFEDATWVRGEDAATLAAAMGADLAIVGEITYFFAGGTAGDTRMALRLQILDAGSGALIWSMEQSGHMTKMLTQDFIIFEKESRLPASPVYAITAAMAEDMGQPVEMWSRSFKPTEAKTEESFTSRIKRWITMQPAPNQNKKKSAPEEGVSQPSEGQAPTPVAPPSQVTPPNPNQSLF